MEKSIIQDPLFPVVGIGASAGGLEAFEKFFATMPLDIGMAFILVPHLDPGHASMMTDLLRRATKLEVKEAEDGEKVLPNHIYVIPPNKEMSIKQRTLKLGPLQRTQGVRMPIDSFLRSLAEDGGEMTIGIILSGTGTDGTLGIRAIHGAGGTVMAQTPSSAKYPGMPQSAVQTGSGRCGPAAGENGLTSEELFKTVGRENKALGYKGRPAPEDIGSRPGSNRVRFFLL